MTSSVLFERFLHPFARGRLYNRKVPLADSNVAPNFRSN